MPKKTNPDTFWATVDRCREIVSTWPEWMQRIVINCDTIDTGRLIDEEYKANGK